MNTSRFPFFGSVLAAVLSIAAIRSAAASEAAPWKPLFNGKDLTGWYIFLERSEKNKDPDKLVQVHNGEIHMYKDAAAVSRQPFGYIATENTFSNYHLRLQYRWGEKKFAPRNEDRHKRDAGLLYHLVGNDNVWPRCVECQIQEGDTGDFFALQTRITSTVDPASTNGVTRTNATGQVRTTFQPVYKEHGVSWDRSTRIIRSSMNETEGWNTVEVIVRGDTAVHIVNGKTNNSCTNIRQQIGTDWVPLKDGRIALQLEGAELFYRGIQIRELKE